MDSNKTPGTDGLPTEFYKFFWKDISTLLVSALNYAFESGCLSITQKRGVIKLIPKKDAELYYIKNWRPITLLNTDYIRSLQKLLQIESNLYFRESEVQI